VVVLGDDAEQFFQTDLGRYVLGAAEQEIHAELNNLMSIQPEDVNKVRQSQTRIERVKLAIQWLNEVIAMGRQEQERIQIEE
jgi:hypothetical protein